MLGENQHISGNHPISSKTFQLKMSDEIVLAAADLHFHNCDVMGNSGKKLDMKTFNLKLSADSITYSSYYGQMYSACSSRVPLIFEGEGFVRFSVELYDGLPSGTVIENRATIVFE